MSTHPLKWRSGALTDGDSRAPARAMLRAVGLTDEDFTRPLIGVANTWIEIGPCNYHLRELAAHVKEGIRQAGGTPLEFNTVSISDGITMGSEGMRASLVSREVMTDSIELVARGNLFDAIIVLVGCDKTIPAGVMALARLDIPGLVLYGGSIAPGRFQGRDVTIQDVFEAVGAHDAGKMTDAEFDDLERHACPGAGACGGMFTANTMATVCETLGISPFGSASVPADDEAKAAVARKAGAMVVDVLSRGLRPRQIITKQSIENAIASVAATGGSTNAVLHLLAIANEAGVALDIDDFDRVSTRTPLIADLKPGGRFVANDLHRAGGVPLVIQRLADAGLLHKDAITISGRTHWRARPRGLGDGWPAGRASGGQPAQADRRPGDPEGQPRAGRRGGQGGRLRRQAVRRSGARVRRRGSGDGRGPRSGGSCPATSWRFATKARAAVRACARCSRSPARSWAPGSAIRWRC